MRESSWEGLPGVVGRAFAGDGGGAGTNVADAAHGLLGGDGEVGGLDLPGVGRAGDVARRGALLVEGELFDGLPQGVEVFLQHSLAGAHERLAVTGDGERQ